MINRKVLFYIAFVLMITTFLPVLFRNLPPIIRSHHFWALLWVVALVMLAPKTFKQKIMIYSLFYVMVFAIMTLFIWGELTDWDKKAQLYQIYYICISVSIISYFQAYKKYHELAVLLKWTLLFIFITAVLSIISSFLDPMYARKLTNLSIITDEIQRERLMEIRNFGGGTYDSSISFMSLIPAFIYFYKQKYFFLISKKIVFIVVITLFFALISMQLFANILIGIFVLIFSILGVNKFKQSLTIVFLLSVILFLIPRSVYSSLFQYMSDVFKTKNEVSYKFNEMSEFLESGIFLDDDTAIGKRGARYPLLFKQLLKEPFIGSFLYSNQNEINQKIAAGGHIFWMYKLVTTGLFMFLLFSLILISHLKYQLKIINGKYKFYYLLSSSSLLVYGLLKNIAGREPWYVFFIILPGIFYLPFLNNKFCSKERNINEFSK